MKIINNIFIQKRWNQAQIQDYLQNSQEWQKYFICVQKAEENCTTQTGLDKFNQAVDIYNQILRRY